MIEAVATLEPSRQEQTVDYQTDGSPTGYSRSKSDAEAVAGGEEFAARVRPADETGVGGESLR